MSSRTIKFRSWVEDHYEYNVPVNKNGKYSKCTSTGFALQYDPSYKEYGVEEFTGASPDKNGVDIYEADVVRFSSYYHGDSLMKECTETIEYDTMGFNDNLNIGLMNYPEWCEVVGNIHGGVVK